MISFVVNKLCNFNIFGFRKEILRVLDEVGFRKPTDIQKKCIPLFLKGHDILGIAKTGSGKTAAYILPILNKISKINKIQSLILLPTRELVIQTTNFFNTFNKYIKLNILSLYGGQKYNIQLNSLKKGVHIIVATPGRLLDHLKSNNLSLSELKILVLDEADEMLRMGFIEDVKKIIFYTNKKRQNILFSATMPFVIKKIVYELMRNPKEVYVSKKKYNIPSNITQYYCLVSYKNKRNILMKFLESEFYSAAIIFVRTKIYTTELSSFIESRGYSCLFLNGDMTQDLRERTINKLRNGEILILVATDIASRGLDIKNINLVINYDIPMDIDSYVHRIGRTGRVDEKGKTILFVSNSKENRFLFFVKKYIKNINKINIPSNKVLLRKRFLKISDLISNVNLRKDTKFFLFLNKFLNKIIKHLNLDINKISISLLALVYERFFSFISLEKNRNFNKF